MKTSGQCNVADARRTRNSATVHLAAPADLDWLRERGKRDGKYRARRNSRVASSASRMARRLELWYGVRLMTQD
jgi:hypothetical protein